MELVYPNERKLFRIAVVLSAIFWLLLIVGTLGVALIYIGFGFLFALFIQAGFITHVKGHGILITPDQYPDLYQQLTQSCAAVGVEEVPDTYLLRTDFFNALATRFLRRHYIVLFTDVVDALEAEPGAVKFYIGHELGHIHRHHIFWGWILFPALLLPILGAAYRRAEEYTCDRYGNACCDTSAEAHAAVAAMTAGDTRWRTINVDAYVRQTEATGGFWMSLNEITGEYPWTSKRMAWVAALRAGNTPDFPRRHALAWLLSIFVPRIPGGFAALIIYVAIIGIIAAVALPAYQDYIKNANAAKAAMEQLAAGAEEPIDPPVPPMTVAELAGVHEELLTLHADADAYWLEHQTFPSDFTDLGWQSAVLYTDEQQRPTQIFQDGIIGVYFGSNAEDQPQLLIHEPVIETEADGTNRVDWYCHAQNIEDAMLPEVCQP